MKKLDRGIPRRTLRMLKAPTVLLLAVILALVLVAVADNAIPLSISAATETLNPNADDAVSLDVVPAGGTNWEACSAAGGSYVSSNANSYETDLYTLPDPVLIGSINSVTVWMTARASTTPDQESAQTAIRTSSGTTTYGTPEILTTSWNNFSTVYATIPGTSNPWTWDEVNTLSAGVALRKPAAGGTSHCDHVWVVVDYTPPGTPTALIVDAASSTYGGTVDLTATLSPAVAGKTIEFFVNGESKGSATTLGSGVATLTGAALTVGGVPLTVGTYTGTYNTSGVGASFASDATYEASTSAADLTVNQKQLTVSGITADDKTYDGGTNATIHTGSAALVGVVGSDNVSLDTSAAAGAFAAKDAGTGITVQISGLTLNGVDAGRYVLIQPTATANINAKALTITADSTSKTYGDAVIFAGTEFTAAGLVSGDNVTSVALASAGAAAGATVAGSPYDIVPSNAAGAGLGNYTISYMNGALTVNAKALTITADSRSKTYSETVTFAGTEFTALGMVNGDNVTSVTLTSAGAASGAAVGSYDIVPSDAVGTGLGNYTIGYINGTLTVNPAAPTISSVNPSQGVQGETLNVTISGSNFTGASAVGFGADITVNSFTADNATQITANITIDASAAPGLRDVSVTSSAGTGTLTGGFTIVQAPPVVESVTPNQGIQGQMENVTITGTHFTGATSVDFGPGITTNSFVVIPSSAPSEVQIGTGTVNHLPPFWTSYDDARTQSILLASDIGQAGEIHKLRLYCSARPGQNLANFYIRMQHTAMTSFSSGSYVNGGWTTVLHATGVNVAAWTVPGWVEFEFTTPFDYDGVSNLLIDYCVDNSYATTYGTVQATTNPVYRTIYYTANLASGDLLSQATGTRTYYVDNVILVLHNGDTIEANVTIDGAATPGYRDVSVTTPGGTDTEASGFTVLAMPTISSVSPSQAVQGEALSVAITGNNFSGVTTVDFGPGIAVTFTVDNTTQITASITVSGSATVGARNVSVTNGAGTCTLTDGFTVNQAPPTISSVSPNQEVQDLTLNVAVSGAYFTGASTVSFGSGITVNSFNVDSATQIMANITIAGSATAGSRDVSVTTPGGTATLTNGFAVLTMPTIGSVSPNQAIQGQALSVTIAGTNLIGVTAVGFGSGITVNSFTVDSDIQITANIAVGYSATVGVRDVSVTKAGGTATFTSGFTVNHAPPAIEYVTPNQGAQGQTTNVMIIGTHFTGATSVDFGSGITVNSFVVTPSSGPSEVQVGAGTSAMVLPFWTSYYDTRSQSILLASEIGQPGVIQKLRLYCAQRPGQNLSHFYIRMQHTAMTSFSSANYVNSGWTIVLDATDVNVAAWTVPGWVEFEFTTPFEYDGVSNLLIDYCVDNSFSTTYGTCNYSVTPTDRTIYSYSNLGSGDLLNQASGSLTTWRNNVVLVLEADTIEANITINGAATPGYRSVSVTTPAGTDTEADGFAVLGTPTISSVNPSQAVQGEALSVTVTGTNLFGVTTVGFGSGITVNSFTVNSSTQITASITVGGSATLGTRDVSVTNAAGTCTLTDGFMVNQSPPTISSVNPNQEVQGLTLDVTISGSYFTGASAVSFGSGITVNSFNVDSAAQITATITIAGSATAESRDVSVTTPGGTATLTGGFTVLAMPTISSVSPSQAIQGQALSVTITGTNLVGVTAVAFGSGITVDSFTVDSDTQITASIAVSDSATPGARDVWVTKAGGTSTLTSGFTVNQAPPVVGSVIPSQGIQGQTEDVTITGTHFTGTTSVDFGPGITTNSFVMTPSSGPSEVQVGTETGTWDYPFSTLYEDIRTQSILLASEIGQGGQIHKLRLYCTSPGRDLSHFYIRMQHTTMTSFPSSSFVNGGWTTVLHATNVDMITGWMEFEFTTPFDYDGVSNLLIDYCVDNGDWSSSSNCRYTTATNRSIYYRADLGSGNALNQATGTRTSRYNNVVLVLQGDTIEANITIAGEATPGYRDVSVTTPGGTDTLTNGFTVLALPTISSVNPTQAVQGQSLSVTITGANFLGATAVGFGSGITVNDFTVDSDTQITASLAVHGSATVGARDVSVTNASGTATLTNGFTVLGMPTVSSVNPTQAVQGQALSVTITGTNLLGVTTMGFGSGITVNSFTVDNATQITASIAVSGSATVGYRDVSVTNAAGAATLTSGFTVNQAPPVIVSVIPNQGIQGQTDNITITGNYFTGATSVSFGSGITVNGFSVDSDTQITANITIDGAATSGYRDVSVTTPEGTDTEVNSFLVVTVPTIDSISPAQAIQGQALSITITGTDLFGVTTVDFGPGITVNSFTVDNATQITASIAVSGSAAVGARDVSVTNAAGTATLTGGFTVNQAPPAITSVIPNQGVVGYTENVTILGSYFTGATSVDFGSGITVNSFTVDNATQITVSITIDVAATAGHRDVSVTTPAGTDTLTDGFLVVAMPTIGSVSPAQAIQGQALSVIITGANFLGVTNVSFGPGVTVNSFTADNSTQMTASITVSGSASAGSRNVSVTNAAGTATLTNGFTVNQAPPAIASVNPNQGLQGQTLDVTVSGSYFTGVSGVSFGADITVNSFTVVSSTQIRANITIGGSAAPELRNVSVTTPVGTATLTNGFTVVAMPTITSVDPGQAAQGQTLSVTITGTNLLGATAVSFGQGIAVKSFTVNSSTEIVANITVAVNATVGTRDVSVTTPATVVNLADGFTVLVMPSPELDLLTPASGKQGAKLEVVITGANFVGATDIKFGEGVTVDDFNVDSATQITAQISIAAKAAPGMRDVSVTTPDGTVTVADVFEVQAKTGSGGIPVYAWLLPLVLVVGAGLVILAFAIKRRKKRPVEISNGGNSAS